MREVRYWEVAHFHFFYTLPDYYKIGSPIFFCNFVGINVCVGQNKVTRTGKYYY